jgi:hypothetical protein
MAAPPDWVTLRIFLAALDLGSVTKAADQCGIATSAAAKRIQLLEQDCKVALLERGARGVRPTAAGEVLARYARSLIDFAARLGDDLRAYAAGGLGSVRLHVTASALAGHDLARVLAAFAVEQTGCLREERDVSKRHLPITRSGVQGSLKPLGLPGPRQEPLELAGLGPARDHTLEHVGEPRRRLDFAQRRPAS